MDLNDTPSWYAKRPYIHFDLPLSAEVASNYVCDPEKVARHAFYPLLRYEILTPRIKKSTLGSGRPFEKEPKKRSIAYPAHKDGYIFSYYKSILESRYEEWLANEGLDETVTAFRSFDHQNNVTLAKKAFDFIRSNPNCRIVVTDVTSFFDHINHELLKSKWTRFLGVSELPNDHYAVFKAITRYSYVEKHKAYNLFRVRLSGRLDRLNSPKRLCTPRQFREKVVARGLVKRGAAKGAGIPQGTSLSPLLSNIYMADLDLAMYKWVSSFGGKYWRYCDDILVVLPGQNGPDISKRLDLELNSLELTRSDDKTNTYLSGELGSQRQLQYLGLVFNGRHTVIRSSSIHRYRRKIKKSVRLAESRQIREGHGNPNTAPFRKQALYNMYSEKPLRGKRIRERVSGRKYKGNFTHYMGKAAKRLNSSRLSRQRLRELRKLKSRLRHF